MFLCVIFFDFFGVIGLFFSLLLKFFFLLGLEFFKINFSLFFLGKFLDCFV